MSSVNDFIMTARITSLMHHSVSSSSPPFLPSESGRGCWNIVRRFNFVEDDNGANGVRLKPGNELIDVIGVVDDVDCDDGINADRNIDHFDVSNIDLLTILSASLSLKEDILIYDYKYNYIYMAIRYFNEIYNYQYMFRY